ncbi:MAG: hypothetical protein ACRDYD_05405 [Acidimicrobiales bacterium]
MMTLWFRAIAVDGDGSPVRSWVVEAEGLPDLAAVDRLASLMLEAQRAGGRIVVARLAPEMADLLDLAGLSVEVQREAEGGEEPLGVQGVEEESQLGDPPA